MKRAPTDRLKELRVLIVEDQMLIAELLEDCLTSHGCQVVGPTGTVEAALELVRSQTPNAAVLDVNLGHELVYPVAEELEARNIPFAFTTGYGEQGLPERWRSKPRLAKPYNDSQFEQFMYDVFLTPDNAAKSQGSRQSHDARPSKYVIRRRPTEMRMIRN